MRRFFSCAVLLWLAVSWAGCGTARRPGEEVSGTVRLDGRPLSRGSVVLVPINGTQGPKCYALVEQGRFHIPAAEGPFPGTYRVEIYSAVQQRVPLQGVEGHSPNDSDPPPVAPRFNTRSQLVVEIASGVPAELTLEVSSSAASPTGGSPKLQ